jgi:hypothetical protein
MLSLKKINVKQKDPPLHPPPLSFGRLLKGENKKLSPLRNLLSHARESYLIGMIDEKQFLALFFQLTRKE